MSELIMTIEQKQNLSQKAIQNLEILQMGAQDLDIYLNNVALENPVIELDPVSPPEEEIQVNVTYSNEDYISSTHKLHSPQKSTSTVLEQTLTDSVNSLSDHLLFQLIPFFNNKKDKSIFYYLVESLDSNGFLTVDSNTLCEVFRISQNAAHQYISALQSVEPTGIGASTLKECLLLQLQRLNHPSRNLAFQIISKYFDEFANNHLKPLAKLLNVSTNELLSAIALIKTLNPKPANGFCCNELATYIQPDVIILQKHEHFQITINRDLSPGFSLNDNYRPMLNHSNQEIREYLYQKFQQADWINKCLEQRNSTLLRITKQILINQKPFFWKGPDFLRPLNQSTLGQQLELNDSTISRAIHDKYLECFWGVFPLKYFFSKGVVNNNSEMTVEHLKKILKRIIDTEDKLHPLSDQKLAIALSAHGISVARRTIAKYRNDMLIPDTSKRRII